MLWMIKIISILLFALAPIKGAAGNYELPYQMIFYDVSGKEMSVTRPAIQLNELWSGNWDNYKKTAPTKLINHQIHTEVTLADGKKVYIPSHGLHDGLVPVAKNGSKISPINFGSEAVSGSPGKDKECKNCKKNEMQELIDAVTKAQGKQRLQYGFEDCNQFINEDTNKYGPFGKMIRDELLKYDKILDDPEITDIMTTGQSRPFSSLKFGSNGANPNAKINIPPVQGCAGYKNFSKEEQIFFFVSVIKDLSAGESGCRYWATENNMGGVASPAIGLLQLNNDIYKDNGITLPSQQGIRTENATSIGGTCNRKPQAAGFPVRGEIKHHLRSVQSLHNPAANLSCGVGIFMRSLGEGLHPIRSGYFGPLNRNDKKPGTPFGHTRTIYSEHPLCKRSSK